MHGAPDMILFDWWALEMAFGHVAPGHRSYLDRETGQIVAVHEEVPGDAEVVARIAAEPRRHVLLDPVPSREQHRWMTRFILTVAAEELRTRLHNAILGHGAFRVFKEILQEVPEERARWFAFRKLMLRAHIELWFAERGIVPAAASQPEMIAVGTLRERGHALLERIPANDLPHAIAYLLHLSARQVVDGAEVSAARAPM